MPWQEDVVNLTWDVSKGLFRFARRNWPYLIGTAAAVALFAVSVDAYRNYMRTDVVLLTGPKTGSTASKGREIANGVTAYNPLFQRHYRISTESSDGFAENLRRVDADQHGTVVGFAHDGFQYDSVVPQQARVILPLHKSVLHIICTRSFYDASDEQLTGRRQRRIALQPAAAAPPMANGDEANGGEANGDAAKPDPERTFGHIAGKLKKFPDQNVYLGPRESGTRQLAKLVLDRYQLSDGQLDAHGIANWEEMRAALNRGDIDVAFAVGPKNSETVRNIASDGNCYLLGLDDLEAIIQDHSYLTKDMFVAKSYDPTGVFCNSELATISSKTVLIANVSMSTSDAYALSKRMAAALDIRQDKPWETLRYRIHPGAELFRTNRRPSWLENLNYLWATLGISLLLSFMAEAIRRMRGPQGRPPAEPPATPAPVPDSPAPVPDSPSPAEEHEQLRTELSEAVNQLESESQPMPAATALEWRSRIRAFRRRIRSLEDQQYDDEAIEQLHGDLGTLEFGLRAAARHDSVAGETVAGDSVAGESVSGETGTG